MLSRLLVLIRNSLSFPFSLRFVIQNKIPFMILSPPEHIAERCGFRVGIIVKPRWGGGGVP